MNVQKLKNSASKLGFATFAVVAPLSAFATTDDDITAGFTTGQVSYLLAVSGIIGLVAAGVGVKMIIGMMKSS